MPIRPRLRQAHLIYKAALGFLAAAAFGAFVAFTIINAIINSPAAEPTVIVATPMTTVTLKTVDIVVVPGPTTSLPLLNVRTQDVVDDLRLTTNGGWAYDITDTELVLLIRSVCDDFDNGLWFYDIYDRHLTDLRDHDWNSTLDADDLFVVMGDGVLAFCPYHEDRLPSEVLGD